MAIKNVFVLLFGVACAISSAQAGYCGGCVPVSCGSGFAFGPGVDVCSHTPEGGALVVRPQALPKPPPLPVKPLPGPCSCTKAIVRPAVVPRPVTVNKPSCSCNPGCCTGSCSSGSYSNKCASSSSIYSSGLSTPADQIPSDCQPIQYPRIYSSNPASIAPADPVSLSIAYKLAQQNCIRGEDKLSFGFTKLPKELPKIVQQKNNIPEEKLFRLNGQIVELKPVKCNNKKSLAEEAAEGLLEESEELVEPSDIRRVSLGEIGYAPAKIVAAPFVDVPIGNPTEVLQEAALKASKCNDGFIPGNVVFQTVPKLEPIMPTVSELCESSEEFDLPGPGRVVPSTGCCTHFSSSKAHHKQNIIFQKLSSGCL